MADHPLPTPSEESPSVTLTPIQQQARIATAIYDTLARPSPESFQLYTSLAPHYPAAALIAFHYYVETIPPRPRIFNHLPPYRFAAFFFFITTFITAIRLFLLLALATVASFAQQHYPEVIPFVNIAAKNTLPQSFFSVYKILVSVLATSHTALTLPNDPLQSFLAFALPFLPVVTGAVGYVCGLLIAYIINLALRLSGGILIQ